MAPGATGSSAASAPPEAPVGAYGLRLTGVDAARALLVPAHPDWPAFELVARVGPPSSTVERVSDERAELRTRSGGEITIVRSPGRAVFTAPRQLRVDELVHPYLAPAAAVIGRWLGRESFHAAAVVTGRGVWGLLGERESGKSSTLAWLATRGCPIVCDDMLIVEDGAALAGPRSIDLRPEAAERLGAGEPIGITGARERWRLVLDPLTESLPLRGWIFLEWGDELSVSPLRASERVARLFHHRGVRLPSTSPDTLLELAALPAWELRRPPRWDSLAPAAERLLDVATS